MRKFGVVIGSKSDLKQCVAGIMELEKLRAAGLIEVPFFRVLSCHRNMLQLFWFLLMRHLWRDVDVLIVGAGWAAHLIGICDAFLRYVLKNTRIVIVGVGFEDPANNIHTLAAKLSISEVPGIQAVYADEQDSFMGSDGVVRGVNFFAKKSLPLITISAVKPSASYSFDEVLNFVEMGNYPK